MDYVWENFGLLEWLLVLEAILLITALFFYQVAKIIARTDRHDPLVRFYRVFWRAFKSPVQSVNAIELSYAEAAAMAAGLGHQGPSLDAPDLGALNESEMRAVPSEMSQQEHRSAPAAPSPRAAGSGDPQNVSGTFDVTINPDSTRDAIVGLRNGTLVIDVQCSAEDGHANGVIIDLIAPRLAMAPYQITLLKGHYKVFKSFRALTIDQATLNARLQRMG